MAAQVEPLFTVEQARRIIGPLADLLSDDQIRELVDVYDRTAKLLIRSKTVQNNSKHKN